MKILSDFKDYYDTVNSGWIDTDSDPVYHRFRKRIDYDPTLPHNPLFSHKIANLSYRKVFSDCNLTIIGFCGEVYAVFRVHDFISYDSDDVLEYLMELKKLKPSSKKYYRGIIEMNMMRSREYFEKYFIYYNVPVFTISEQNMILNDRLNQYDFVLKKDPWTAYQEISMYLGGVLRAKEPDTVDISEKDKIIQKGFDKWSFRKLPSKRRKHGNTNR